MSQFSTTLHYFLDMSSSIPQPPLKGTDKVNVVEVFRDLDYNEVHSLTLGLSLAFLAVVSPVYREFFAIAGISLLFIALRLRKAPTGSKYGYIVREPHYYIGGLVLGVGSGFVVGLAFQLLLNAGVF
jgi:hypothetical protein